MSCESTPFTIWKGCTFSESIFYYQSDGVTPVNLSGYSGKMDFRHDGVLSVTLSTAISGMTLGGISGSISLSMPHTVTSTIEAPEGDYDLVLINASGAVLPPLIYGHWTLRETVTQ